MILWLILVVACASALEILSPRNNSLLITDRFLVLLQFLDSDRFGVDGWQLCINTNASVIVTSLCWNSYADSDLGIANSTFTKFYHLNSTGPLHFYMEAVMLRFDVRSDAAFLEPIDASVSTTVYFSAESQTGLHLRPTEHAGEQRTIMDATFLHQHSLDMLQIRLHEHQPDLAVLVDTNETHSGLLEKEYVVPDDVPQQLAWIDGTGVALQAMSCDNLPSSPDGVVSKLYPHCQAYIVRPPQEEVALLREPLHRNSMGVVWHLSGQGIDTVAPGGDGSTMEGWCIISDTDEVLKREVVDVIRIPGLIPSNTIIFPQLDFYLYNFNWRFANMLWGLQGKEGAVIIPHRLCRKLQLRQEDANNGTNTGNLGVPKLSATNIRRLLRPDNRALMMELAREYNFVFWHDAGWHLSQFYAPEVMAEAKQMAAFPATDGGAAVQIWTPENCRLMQKMGVAHFMLQLRAVAVNATLASKAALQFLSVHRQFSTEANSTTSGLSLPDAIQWDGRRNISLPHSLRHNFTQLQRYLHPCFAALEIQSDDGALQCRDGPSEEDRRAAIVALGRLYHTATGAQAATVAYTANNAMAARVFRFVCTLPEDAGERVDNHTSIPLVKIEADGETRLEVAAREHLRKQAMEHLFCDNKEKCPYVAAPQAVALVVQEAWTRCQTTQEDSITLRVLIE